MDKFKTVRRANNGTVTEWAELSTVDNKGNPRKFGAKKAQHVIDFLEGR
jgi:hypothetical protein